MTQTTDSTTLTKDPERPGRYVVYVAGERIGAVVKTMSYDSAHFEWRGYTHAGAVPVIGATRKEALHRLVLRAGVAR